MTGSVLEKTVVVIYKKNKKLRLGQNEISIYKTRMFTLKVYVFTQARSTCAPDPRFPWGGS